MAIWKQNKIHLTNCGADYLCNTSTNSFISFGETTYIFCWGGSVSGWFGGWMLRNDHPKCVFGTKNCTHIAQSYSVIPEFMTEKH